MGSSCSNSRTEEFTESLHVTDPAAEEFQYPVSFDVRDLVTLEDVVEECQLGPNGCVLRRNAGSTALLTVLTFHCGSADCVHIRGLLYCMEYLEENLDEWLAEELEVWTFRKVIHTVNTD